jgi:signal transduction histidine kinase
VVVQFALVSLGFFWYRAEQQALFERELLSEGASALQPAALLFFLLLKKDFVPDSGTQEQQLSDLRELISDSPAIVVYDEEGKLEMGAPKLAQYIVPRDLTAQIQQAQYQGIQEFEYDNFAEFAARRVEQPVFMRFRYLEHLGIVVGYGTSFDTRSVRLAMNARWSLRETLSLLGVIAAAVTVYLVVGFGLLRWGVNRWIGPLRQVRAPAGIPSDAKAATDLAVPDLKATQLNAALARISALQSTLDEMKSDAAYKDRLREEELCRLQQATLQAERVALVRRMNSALAGAVIEPLRQAAAAGNGTSTALADIVRNYELIAGAPLHEQRQLQEVRVQEWLNRLIEASARPGHVNVENQTRSDLTAFLDSDVAADCVQPLLENAIRAASEQEEGRVQVDANRGDHGLEIRIVDNGSGIARDARPLVTAPFYSTDAERPGLGLSRAQALAAALNGSIQLHSEVGRGTAAVVTLPMDDGLRTP